MKILNDSYGRSIKVAAYMPATGFGLAAVSRSDVPYLSNILSDPLVATAIGSAMISLSVVYTVQNRRRLVEKLGIEEEVEKKAKEE